MKKREEQTDSVQQNDINYVQYYSEHQLPDIMKLIEKELSEPYSIFTFRYFTNTWPSLSFLAMDGDKAIGTIVCKLDKHKSGSYRGYIAMLSVEKEYRKKGIGSKLVCLCIQRMKDQKCDEIVLETETTNTGALYLYENLGFLRDKRLKRYYLNGGDAFRLKLWIT